MSKPAPLLEVNNLRVVAAADSRELVLVDDLSFDLRKGEIVGVVGESGSGKSISALAILGLLDEPVRTSGSVRFEGRELVGLSEDRMRTVRGGSISMIFQEPSAALNPVFTIGVQIEAAIRAHRDVSRSEARRHAAELLRRVGIPDPDSRLSFYPHQLSGGMCQRVMIAMALAADAALVIADEPTTALDVTIQADIVRLLRDLVAERGLSLLFISHDLGLVSAICDRVIVMYAGQIVEIGGTDSLLRAPMHPYLQGLAACITDLDQPGTVRGGIPGHPPVPGGWPEGCRFQPRCPLAGEGCERRQEIRAIEDGHAVRCWRAGAAIALPAADLSLVDAEAR